jgi:tRNA pseudouridine55 synthase
MNGVLVVDKPSGPTSHDVVGRVRRALSLRRVGHTGTLDPLATGVLPLVLGRATRLARFLSPDDKEYLADVAFGVATSTYDALGQPAGAPSPHAEALLDDGAALERALSALRGTYAQMPPAFSAKKVGGRRAHAMARAGQEPHLMPVEVTVSALEIVERRGPTLRLRVACSSGFYVRTLAHELGQRLGCGAHLSALRRTRVGAFDLSHAVTLSAIDESTAARERLIGIDQLLPWLPEVRLSAGAVQRVSHGNRIGPADYEGPGQPEGLNVRLVDESGSLLAIAQSEAAGTLHPVVVVV